MVLVHGSSTRTYQTTFDGQPGFQSIFLADKYPVYLVDLPWTGRAGKACYEYTWSPVNNTFSARFVFTNRVGLWPANTPESAKEFFPGVAFPKDPKAMDQYFRNQYVEFNAASNTERESTALAVLLEEVYKQHGARPSFTPTLQATRADCWSPGRQTNSQAKSAGNRAPLQFSRKASCRRPIPRADGVLVPAGTEIPLAEFLKLTKHPILLIWGDYIPKTLDPAYAGTTQESRRIFLEQYKLFAQAANKYGGNVRNVILPEIGISGNTHYPMADTNITQVSRFVSQWLKQERLD